MPDTFGALLRRLRRDSGLSQEELAERAGLSRDAVSTLERGTRRAPYRDTVANLAEALGLEGAARSQLEQAADSARVRKPSGEHRNRARGLPVWHSPLVGSDVSLTNVLDLLQASRLITLVGPGGIGKTRIAVAAAESYSRKNDADVWFVDLSVVRTEEDVVGKIASATAARLTGQEPAVDDLLRGLASSRGVLLLDNCEHVLDEVVGIAARIVRRCANVTLLATSRERLAVDGEIVYAIAPLEPSAALELFAVRAAGAASSFEVNSQNREALSEICGRVDGIPLAIELAAARVPSLGLPELLARLRGQLSILEGGRRDAPVRHKTMHDTIAWSVALLEPAQRAIFRRLSAFSGGWNLDAVTQVAGVNAPDSASVTRSFLALVDRSLVAIDIESSPARYRLLEPIRLFARDAAIAANETDQVARQHARWIAGIMESDTVDTIVTEIDNVRRALEWALGDGDDVPLAAKIVSNSGSAWSRIGLSIECRRWCEAVIARLDTVEHPQLATRVFRALILSMGGKDEIDAIARAIPLHERLEDWNGVAVLTSRMALRYGERGRFEEANRAFARVFELRELYDLGETAEWATIWMHRGSVYRRQGRLDEAQRAIDASLSLSRSLDKPLHEVWALLPAAEIAFANGDADRAIGIAEDTIERCRFHHHVVVEVLARANLAGYLLAAGAFEKARDQAMAAIDLGQQMDPRLTVAATLHLAAAEAMAGNVDRAFLLKAAFDAMHEREQLELDQTSLSSERMFHSALPGPRNWRES